MISNKASQPTSDLNSKSELNAEPNMVLSKAYAAGKIILQGNQQSKALTRICKDYSDSSADSIVRIDLEGDNRIIEYEPLDQVITVETGIKVDQLNEIVGSNNQQFPCSGHGSRSLLDVINSGDCGPLEHSNSGMRSLILGLTIALPNGELIKTGGKVVKNVSGYDLTKLFVGSRGTLGLPLQAHLRLSAKPQQSVTMAFVHRQYSVLQKALNKLLRTGLQLSACEFLTGGALAKWSQGAVLILHIAEHQSVIAELIPQIESFLLVDEIEKMECEQIVFAEIDDAVADKEWIVETSLSQKQFALIEKNLQVNSIAAYYRPGIGRLKILAGSENDAKSVSGYLKNLALIEEPILVASARDKFEYYVEQFPDEDENLSVIKSRIKSQFDPDNRLNPFARS